MEKAPFTREYHWTSEDAHLYTEKAIYFDMDGTIADLYAVPDWCAKLDSYDASPYYDAPMRLDPEVFWDFCSIAASEGFRIGIVSWNSKTCPDHFGYDCIDAKLAWCDEMLPVLHEIAIVPYGTPKSGCVEITANAILVDDEERNRTEWADLANNRIAYSTEDIVRTLEDIAAQCHGDELDEEYGNRTCTDILLNRPVY